MRIGTSAIVVASLLLSPSAFAGTDSQNESALTPGGAAGIQQAQEFSVPMILSVVGVVGVAVAVAILVSNSNGSTSTKAASGK
jgi:hypothetical protein